MSRSVQIAYLLYRLRNHKFPHPKWVASMERELLYEDLTGYLINGKIILNEGANGKNRTL
jgi:hypothetical protein